MEPVEPLKVRLPAGWSAWSAFQKLIHLPHVLFLDSAAFDAHMGRYSFITADPFQKVVAYGPEEIRQAFRAIHTAYDQWHVPPQDELPPFQGGLAGLWGYGVSRGLERLPAPRKVDFDTPDLCLGWYDWVLAFDHEKQVGWLISTGLPAGSREGRRVRAKTRAGEILALLERNKQPVLTVPHQKVLPVERLAESFPVPSVPGVLSNFSSQAFRQAIRRVIAYTHAGDCFQVNLAQRLLTAFWEHPGELYRRLRERNPASFAAYFDLGDYVVASASPERFILLGVGGDIETRPIKGTRPRGSTHEEDVRLAAELEASAKDRAENIMIVDLLRNDLGRIAEYGSVSVAKLCSLESNAAVHHLVSVIRAQLRHGFSPLDVLEATLPGGSVTGAPKVRAMEIIAELEPTARGPYCGSLGYVSFTGAMDTSILIRTFTLGRGWAQFPVGGGIVADSDPEMEYAETLHKASRLLAALK